MVWSQLENLTNFIKATTAYGLKPHDIFEANDLFENGNMTQVQTALLALANMVRLKKDTIYDTCIGSDVFTIQKVKFFFMTAFNALFSQAKTKGIQSRVDIGVKYADKQERVFDEEKMKAGQCVIGLQVYIV